MTMRHTDNAVQRLPGLSRREALHLLGGVGVAALLAACGGEGAAPTAMPSPSPGPAGGAATPATATTGATRVAGTPTIAAATRVAGTPATPTRAAGTPTAVSPALAAAREGRIVIPDTGARLPSGQTVFRVLVQGTGPRTPFYKAFFPAYQQARPTVSVQFDELPGDQIQQVLPIGIQNGNAHDLFMLGGGITTAQAVREGWVAPLDDFIPNFQQWKGRFPPGVFLDGITVFNGKTYTFPLSSNQRYETLLFYNEQLLQQAGLDPAAKPLTWDEFRAAAKKLTEQGKGQYFGLLLGGKGGGAFAPFVGNLAAMAGAVGGASGIGHVNWKTGELNYTTDQFLAAIELLLALKDDGSIFPGAPSLTQREAVARMPQGAGGMTLDGPWVIARWQTEAPGFRYGLASQPVPNTGTAFPLGYEPGGANPHFSYARSRAKEVAGDIFAYWGGLEGQTAFQAIVGGTLRAILPEAAQASDKDAPSRQATALFDRQMRLHPDPRARDPDVAQVFLEYKPLKPSFGETLLGLFTGQLKDPRQAMQDIQGRAEKELERALKAAQAKGAKVSRDDWKFPNWDPAKDYTEADYRAL